MLDRFLPIGSVVLLKGGTKEVMVTSYCILPGNEEIGKDGVSVVPKHMVYEYGACIYPEGIVDSSVTCAFNHSQIDKVLFIGYETDNQKKLCDVLDHNYDKFKKNYESNPEVSA